MKKRIYFTIIKIALLCVLLLSIAFFYLLFFISESDEPVDYAAVAIRAVIVVAIIALVMANNAAKKISDSIIETVENIGVRSENIGIGSENTVQYSELQPFASRTEWQTQSVRAKIEELSNRAETIETITNSMQEGLILIDKDGKILSANKSAHKVFGENIKNKNILHIYRDTDFQKAVRKCKAGENIEIQIERDSRIYMVFISPVITGGNTGGAVILVHDATERQLAEKQSREFTANVSHELKTPLTTISALSEMIEKGMAKEDDVKGFAGRIKEQSGRLLRLIDDIIRLSEFDEGRAKKEATIFDIWELAETVINALQNNLDAGNVKIELTGERFDISANHRMIDELLYNLIDNGIKYNKENGEVTINLTRPENGLCKIIVTDTGIGIDEKHHPYIFERFYRAEKSRSKKTGGTGLGLSIVKHITEYYNGSLELDSKEGKGTTVTCSLKYL
jgi:two-component system phosphate regulon sensor histidine kinase PhoR